MSTIEYQSPEILSSLPARPADLALGNAELGYQFSYWRPLTADDVAFAASYRLSHARASRETSWVSQTEALAKSIEKNTAFAPLVDYLGYRATYEEHQGQDGQTITTASLQTPHPATVNKLLRRLPLSRERRPAHLATTTGRFSPQQESKAMQAGSFLVGLDATEQQEGRIVVTDPTLMHDMGIHALFGYLLTSPWYRNALKQAFQASPNEQTTTIIADRLDMYINFTRTGDYLNHLVSGEMDPSSGGDQEARKSLLIKLGHNILSPFNGQNFTDEEAEVWGKDMVDQSVAILRAIDVITKRGRLVAAFREIFAPVR